MMAVMPVPAPMAIAIPAIVDLCGRGGLRHVVRRRVGLRLRREADGGRHAGQGRHGGRGYYELLES